MKYPSSGKGNKVTIEQVKGGYIVHYSLFYEAPGLSGDTDWWEDKKEVFTSIEDALKFVEKHYK